jgi:hypothetical protein
METKELDEPGQREGFNANLLGIESIIEKAMQKSGNLTLNFFLSPVGQHVERTESAHVWMKKEDGMDYQTIGKTKDRSSKSTPEQIKKALKECKEKGFIWGNAAYAVIFCVCRDAYGFENNATNFERYLADVGIAIPEGTINNCLSRQPWMRFPVDKWEKNGARNRVLKLRDAFRQQIELLGVRENSQSDKKNCRDL